MGSIRAVTNSANEVISAYDYDAWGYKLREWKSGDDAKYRFTGKERDNETGYDYFGARYYDARIGRWGGVEPKYDKYVGFSPYNYSLNNPIIFTDAKGTDPTRNYLGTLQDVMNIVSRAGVDNNGNVSLAGLHKQFGLEQGRYLYTEKAGVLDMKHVFAAAQETRSKGGLIAMGEGAAIEILQKISGEKSNFAPEDPKSNSVGVDLGTNIDPTNIGPGFGFDNPSINLADYSMSVKDIESFLGALGVISPNDKRISPENVYLPEDENASPLQKRNLKELFFAKPYYGNDPKDHSKELDKAPAN
ncbi:MAG: RHS repeat-associated core domain-containing protein [Ignavibacteria bacterium]|nr:RHS repeat-associated core domain-containing protein [Ignavibacteria bacterium]